MILKAIINKGGVTKDVPINIVSQISQQKIRLIKIS